MTIATARSFILFALRIARSCVPRVLSFQLRFFHIAHLVETTTTVTMKITAKNNLPVPPRPLAYRFGAAIPLFLSPPILISLRHKEDGTGFNGPRTMMERNPNPTLNLGADVALRLTPRVIPTSTCSLTLRLRPHLGGAPQSTPSPPSATPPTRASLSLLGLSFSVSIATLTLPLLIGTLSTMSVRSTSNFQLEEGQRNIMKKV